MGQPERTGERMGAVIIDARTAADRGLRGLVPAWTAGSAAADRSPASARHGRAVRSWPLLVLAVPAAAEVWSGWVGIAQKTGGASARDSRSGPAGRR